MNNITFIIKMSRDEAHSNDFCWLSAEKHKGKLSEIGDPESINKKFS